MGLSNLAREHRRYERHLLATIAAFFNGQRRRIVTVLADFDAIDIGIVDQIFRESDEHQRFMAAIGEPVVGIMIGSAVNEYNRNRPQKRPALKAWMIGRLAAGLLDKLPKFVVDRIRATIAAVEQQPFWATIQAATKTRLMSIIQDGIEAGDARPKIAKAIRNFIGGNAPKKRALAIARTEATGAMNSGNYAVHQQLIEDGAISARIWRAILDEDVRKTHRSLDKVSVKAGELFDVGGHKTPYPGWHGLPAKERVNCRCVVTTVVE